MAYFSQFLSKLYTITIVFFTVLILEAVILARSITAIIHDTKNKPIINTKQYLRIIEEKNPSTRFNRTGRFWFDPECAICLSLFEEGEAVRKLMKCKHIFHRDCLDRWLQGDSASASASCPLCRAGVLPEEVMLKYRRFLLNQQESQATSDDEFFFLMSAFHGNLLRGFL